MYNKNMIEDSKSGFSLIEVSLSLGILIIALSVGYYFLYILPQQNSSDSLDLKITPPSQNQTTQQPTAQQPTTEKPKGYYLTPAQMGSPFEVYGVQYVIESAKSLGADLSTSGLGYSKSNGGKYILVKFNAKNLNNNEVSLSGVSIYIRDSNGNNFNPISIMEGLFSSPSGYKLFDNQSWQPTTLKPDFKTELFIVAEVSTNSRGLSIVVANQNDQNYFVPLGI